MSQISRMSHVTNESCHECQWVIFDMWMGHGLTRRHALTRWRQGIAASLRRHCGEPVSKKGLYQSCLTYRSVMSHKNEAYHAHARVMPHEAITHMHESCHTRPSRTCTSHVTRGYHAHARVMSHEAMTHMHKSCHTRLWRTCTSHVTRVVSHRNEAYHSHARVMSHMSMSHITLRRNK